MYDYSKSSHTVYNHRYHIVWITKYRYKVLTHELKKRVRELIAQVCEEMCIKIINGVVSSDHIHLFVEIPPSVKVSEFVQKAKGRSSNKIQEEFPSLRKTYWGRHFWARGYWVSTIGKNEAAVRQYIQNQEKEDKRLEQLELVAL